MTITVLGAKGFIGSNLVRYLQNQGVVAFAPDRHDASIFTRPLGHVISCVGLTADFREKPFDAVKAHVCHLITIVEQCEFDSLLYLSSTRLYGTHPGLAPEESPIAADPMDPNDLYNISKAMGESICFSSGNENIRVARLSNVYGNDFSSHNFIASVLRDAIVKRHIRLRTSLDSEKDYVSVEDVVPLLVKIATSGRRRIYNVAYGADISNRSLMESIRAATGCTIEWDENAPLQRCPAISIQRIVSEFSYSPSGLLDTMHDLVNEYKIFFGAADDNHRHEYGSCYHRI